MPWGLNVSSKRWHSHPLALRLYDFLFFFSLAMFNWSNQHNFHILILYNLFRFFVEPRPRGDIFQSKSWLFLLIFFLVEFHSTKKKFWKDFICRVKSKLGCFKLKKHNFSTQNCSISNNQGIIFKFGFYSFFSDFSVIIFLQIQNALNKKKILKKKFFIQIINNI